MEMGLDKDSDPAKINWISIRHHTLRSHKECGPEICKHKTCAQCKKCWECSCECHHKFDEHRRFYGKKRTTELIQRCKDHVKGDEVPFAKETENRLEGRQMTFGTRVKIPSPHSCEWGKVSNKVRTDQSIAV